MRILKQGLGWRPNDRVPPPHVAAPSAPVEAPARGEFYAARLRSLEQRRERSRSARISIHERELCWMSTPQDARMAWIVSAETGFDAWGIETQVAEIPAGWNTGRHRHGEEAIYVVRGEGFVVVEDRRYDFERGTTIGIPFGAAHQFFNVGSEPVRYLSATPFPLEHYLGLHFLEQLEECGPTGKVPRLPVSHDGLDARGRRIRQRWSEARYRDGRLGWRARLEGWLRAGIDLASRRGPASETSHHAARIAGRLAHHGAWVRTMGSVGQIGFANRLIIMSGFLIDDPGMASGKHAHNEAVIYVVQGFGYSVIDGRTEPWEPGTCMHIRGPQTVHQHFNLGSDAAFLLRIVNGLRPQIEDAAANVFPPLWYEAAHRIVSTATH